MSTTTYKKSGKKPTTLHSWQPKAYALRFEGECPNCRQASLVSYLHPDHLRTRVSLKRGEVSCEDCGYYCDQCRWGNAGARPIEEVKE